MLRSASATKMRVRDIHRATVWTVGHSTRSADDFIALLQAHGIRQLVDVRTIPRSRHNPQFAKEELEASLRDAGIHYLHMPALGGLRHARRDSINTAWRNASFRGYADYMQTPEFEKALGELIRLAKEKPTAIMCAEAVPWRCHRSLIADALVVRGIDAEEIASQTITRPHILTPWARVKGKKVTYPAEVATDSKIPPASASPKSDLKQSKPKRRAFKPKRRASEAKLHTSGEKRGASVRKRRARSEE